MEEISKKNKNNNFSKVLLPGYFLKYKSSH